MSASFLTRLFVWSPTLSYLSLPNLARFGFLFGALGSLVPVLGPGPYSALGFSALLLALDAWLSRERSMVDALAEECKARLDGEAAFGAELVSLRNEIKRVSNSVGGARGKG